MEKHPRRKNATRAAATTSSAGPSPRFRKAGAGTPRLNAPEARALRLVQAEALAERLSPRASSGERGPQGRPLSPGARALLQWAAGFSRPLPFAGLAGLAEKTAPRRLRGPRTLSDRHARRKRSEVLSARACVTVPLGRSVRMVLPLGVAEDASLAGGRPVRGLLPRDAAALAESGGVLAIYAPGRGARRNLAGELAPRGQRWAFFDVLSALEVAFQGPRGDGCGTLKASAPRLSRAEAAELQRATLAALERLRARSWAEEPLRATGTDGAADGAAAGPFRGASRAENLRPETSAQTDTDGRLPAPASLFPQDPDRGLGIESAPGAGPRFDPEGQGLAQARGELDGQGVAPDEAPRRLEPHAAPSPAGRLTMGATMIAGRCARLTIGASAIAGRNAAGPQEGPQNRAGSIRAPGWPEAQPDRSEASRRSPASLPQAPRASLPGWAVLGDVEGYGEFEGEPGLGSGGAYIWGAFDWRDLLLEATAGGRLEDWAVAAFAAEVWRRDREDTTDGAGKRRKGLKRLSGPEFKARGKRLAARLEAWAVARGGARPSHRLRSLVCKDFEGLAVAIWEAGDAAGVPAGGGA